MIKSSLKKIAIILSRDYSIRFEKIQKSLCCDR